MVELLLNQPLNTRWSLTFVGQYMILVLTQKAIEMMSSFVLEIFTYFKEEKLKPFVVLFQSFSDTELFGVRKNKKMFQMVELYSFYKKK